ncbi:hypothetical protein D3C87_1751330 [compost metagenome]
MVLGESTIFKFLTDVLVCKILKKLKTPYKTEMSFFPVIMICFLFFKEMDLIIKPSSFILSKSDFSSFFSSIFKFDSELTIRLFSPFTSDLISGIFPNISENPVLISFSAILIVSEFPKTTIPLRLFLYSEAIAELATALY